MQWSVCALAGNHRHKEYEIVHVVVEAVDPGGLGLGEPPPTQSLALMVIGVHRVLV